MRCYYNFKVRRRKTHLAVGKKNGNLNISYLRILEEVFAILLACGSRQFQKYEKKQVSNIWEASKFCKEVGKHF